MYVQCMWGEGEGAGLGLYGLLLIVTDTSSLYMAPASFCLFYCAMLILCYQS